MKEISSSLSDPMNDIDTMYKEVLGKGTKSDNTALYALFYMLIMMREKIEYSLWKDLETYCELVPEIDFDKFFLLARKYQTQTNSCVT